MPTAIEIYLYVPPFLGMWTDPSHFFFCHFWSNAILPIWSLADNNLYNDFDQRYVIWLLKE